MSQDQIGSLFRELPQPCLLLKVVQDAFQVVLANDAWLSMVGMCREEAENRLFDDLIEKASIHYADDREREALHKDLSGLSDGSLDELEVRFVTANSFQTAVTRVETNESDKAAEPSSGNMAWRVSHRFAGRAGGDEILILQIWASEQPTLKPGSAQNNLEGIPSASGKSMGSLKEANLEFHRQNVLLQNRVVDRTSRFEAASRELDNFIYSVSHDLRAPLRRMDGFSRELLESYSDSLDETGVHYLGRIRQASQDMGQLIDDLLKLSRISKSVITREVIPVGELSEKVFNELMESESFDSMPTFHVLNPEMKLSADPGLCKIVLTNLISNAIKFSSREEDPVIEVGVDTEIGRNEFFVRDNGIGLEMEYAGKLFQAFQRLHSQRDYPGTGIGLATVRRIVTLHGGGIRVESSPGNGATFYFTLESETEQEE
ncbi:MAG: ATP-binding protein [Balneolaceae bacterium]